MKTNNYKFLIPLLLTTGLFGCQSTFGPESLENTHIPYNEAISNTLTQQMLLNIVRMKYRAEPYFLKVSSVTASLKFTGSLGMNTNIDLGPGRNSISPNFGVGYTDSPTLSFKPLEGSDFFKSILTNISLNKLFVLAATGWSIDDIFSLCVDEINGVGNAVKGAGATPKLAPEYEQFSQVLQALKLLQDDNKLKMGKSSQDPSLWLMKFIETPNNRAIIEGLVSLLGLPSSTRLVRIGNVNFLDIEKPINDNSLTIYTRSISSMLFYLSQNIQIPQEHLDKGLVTITKTAEGQVFDWRQTPGGQIFSIKSSDSYPDDAFLAVAYRDHWYYIADNDLQSKSTFMLLMQLFDHQAGSSKSADPVLTIPVR